MNIDRYTPVQPHSLALSAGSNLATDVKSCSKLAHSHINTYCLSPFDCDLCNVILLKPADFGR